MSEYNVPFGKKNRGISVVTSYKLLVTDCTEDDIKLARILGWCVEWVGIIIVNLGFKISVYQTSGPRWTVEEIQGKVDMKCK